MQVIIWTKITKKIINKNSTMNFQLLHSQNPNNERKEKSITLR